MTRYNQDLEIETTPTGQVAVYYAHTDTDRDVPVGGTYDVALTAQTGKLTIGLSALDRDHPRDTHVDNSHGAHVVGDADPTETYHHWPVTLVLYAAGSATPLHTWKQVAGTSSQEESSFEYVVPAGAGGAYRLHVRNEGSHANGIRVSTKSVSSRGAVHTQRLPHYFFDGPLQVILEALTLSAGVEGNNLYWDFGDELKAFAPTSTVLGRGSYTLPDGARANGALTHFDIQTTSGAELIAAARAEGEKLRQAMTASAPFPQSSLIPFMPSGTSSPALDDLIADLVAKVIGPVTPASPVIKLSVAFTNVDWSYDLDVLVGDLRFDGKLEHLGVTVYLGFVEDLFGGTALVLSPATFEGTTTDLLLKLGIISQLGNMIESALGPPLRKALGTMGHYLASALGRLCHKDATVLSMRADAAGWYVDYATPSLPPRQLAGGIGGLNASLGTAELSPLAEGAPAPAPAAPSGDLSTLPAAFRVIAPEAVARLDEIQTIVVVMMENRSFHHLLGYLPNLLPTQGPTSNTVVSGGATQTISSARAADVMLSTTWDFPTPHHDFENVKQQIADGAMTGFAQNYDGLAPGHGDVVMCRYDGTDLPVYHRIATQYGVCDRWFAAHPGGTWPNRWTTLSGHTPMLNNPALSDPLIPYVPGQTIFSFLSQHGIDWRLFESDLSLVRTFDKHRLDGDRVIPLEHPRRPVPPAAPPDFFDMCRMGSLPPVVFVEPNFSDTPPRRASNDDLFPTPPARGQVFVDKVLGALKASGQWAHTLVVITYDEHGGFFDPVAPPGTAKGDPALVGAIPKIHPDGASHLGVRVPALVASPWVSPGSVFHEVFDHTSIIKTILLRHRRSIAPDAMTSFGERVNQAAHLGVVLNEPTPLSQQANLLAEAEAKAPAPSDNRLRKQSELASSLRGAMLLPRPK